MRPGKKTDFEIENRLLIPDGRVKHVHVIARAAKTRDLDFVRAFRDVTERMRTEETVLGSGKRAPGRESNRRPSA
jgi:PAS domain-containing protein